MVSSQFATEGEPENEKQAYNACRYRDACLRRMGENPAQFIDVSVTPCPCDKDFRNEVIRYIYPVIYGQNTY